MQRPRIRHTERCRSLTQKLEDVRWCIGNGACGFSNCRHAEMRQARLAAHTECEASLKERILKHQEITSNDGKSRSSGE